MKFVWVIRFCEEPDMRVAASAAQAYEICKRYIKDELTCILESTRQECLTELAEDYAANPEWFACSDVCGAEMIEVEGT